MLRQNAQARTNDYIPDVQEIVRILWRHRSMIILVGLVTFVLGCSIVVVMPKSYSAAATVMLSDHNPDLTDFHDVTAGAKFDDMTMQTEIKVLTSPTLALQTIKAAALDKVPEFADLDTDQERVSAFEKHLSVTAQGQSRVIEISFKAKDPEVAATVVNEHVKSYLAAQIDFKKQQTENLGQWFQKQVNDMQADVLKKSQAVEDYRTKENLAIGKDDKQLVYQQISDIAAQLVPLDVHKYDLQSKLKAIDDASGSKQPNAYTEIVSSVLIQNLKQQASVASQQLESLRSQYGANHPKVIAARSQLNQANGAIAAEIANIKNSLKNDLAATESQEALINTSLESLKHDADGMRAKMITLNSLEAQRAASQKLLDTFLGNYQNVQAQVNFARPDAFVVSQAAVPVLPAPPGKILMLMIVAIFSGCLALGSAFVVEMTRNGVRNFEDVRNMAQKPLGILPKVLSPVNTIMTGENSSYKEAIRRIYMSGLINNPAKALLITSAMPREGRTTLTITLAHYLMSLGRKVIVIDADFLKPALSRMTSAPEGRGFADVLSGRCSLNDAIDTTANGLAVLRAGSQALTSPDVLQTAHVRDVLDQLKQRYDYVLIDSGPLLAHSEAGIIAGQADGILAIAEWLTTSQQSISNMFEMLRQFLTPVLGVVINKVDIGKYKTTGTGSDFLLPRIANAA